MSSKALVIPGANFSTNKLATVVISDTKPCASITLSQDTISFTKVGNTQQLTATLTPADTTDSVIWESSNTQVATVVDGLVTCVGVGSATITVACGEYEDACSVTAIDVINANTEYTAENGLGFYSVSGDYVRKRSQTYSRLYYSETDELGGFKAFWGEGIEGYAIPIPSGANLVTVKVPSDFSRKINICALDTNTRGATGTSGQCAKANAWSAEVPDSNMESSLSLANVTANGIVLDIQCATSVDASTLTGNVTITFSA